MKKRSKLSLSPDDKVNKKRPAGFDENAAAEPNAEPGATQAKPEPETGPGPEPTAASGETARETTSTVRAAVDAAIAGIDRKKLIKALAVGAVTAGVLYLLKRRLPP